MPFVSYFRSRSKDLKVTGSDGVNLLLDSSRTHDEAGGGGAPVYNPIAHPPHPHAHINKDGFEQVTVTWQLGHANTSLDYRSLHYDRNLKKGGATGKGKQRLESYRNRNVEGLHLDPARRRHYSHPLSQIIDPTNKKGVAKPYMDRKKHSQFQDSEAAAMALVYALNSTAGYEAMNFLNDLVKRRRVSITSITAANALNQGPLAFKNPGNKVLSAHPERGNIAKVIERGPGAAGKAATPTSAIAATVSVFDAMPNGALRLVTHYPVSNTAVVKDSVRFQYHHNNKYFKNEKANGKYTAKVFGGPAAFKWSDPSPSFGASKSQNVPCSRCAVTHGYWPSTRRNPWHQCSSCGAIYCPTHGMQLQTANGGAPARNCEMDGCKGTTGLIY